MMKKIFLLLFSTLLLISCEGDPGPPGFDGRDGVDLKAQSFQVSVNFAAPDYSVTVPYGNLPRLSNDEMALVYILFEEFIDDAGNNVDVWRLLPQTLYSDFGEYQYNYDFTDRDVRIFMDGPTSTNFAFFGPADLNDQTFRVVILPVELASMPGIDFTDYESVMQLGGIDASDIIMD